MTEHEKTATRVDVSTFDAPTGSTASANEARANDCDEYEVCGCTHADDCHCMYCCREIETHRVIPKRQLREIVHRSQRAFGEVDKLRAAIEQALDSLRQALERIEEADYAVDPTVGAQADRSTRETKSSPPSSLRPPADQEPTP